MDELTIAGKTYISSKHAAKITGYAKDYIGQLCREGRVEARLVGRNWYVLQSSVREHRFGKEVGQEEPEAAETDDITATWEAPIYHTEPDRPVLPMAAPAATPKAAADTSRIVSDMQDAWKEWFETRNAQVAVAELGEDEAGAAEQAPEEGFESSDLSNIEAIFGGPVIKPSVQEEEFEEREDPIELEAESLAEEPSADHHAIDLRHFHEPAEAVREEAENVAAKPIERPRSRPYAAQERKQPRGGNLVANAFLWSLAGLSVAIMLIGSGLADRIVSRGAERSPILDFFQGETVYKAK